MVNLKNNKGISGIDIVVSVGIITITLTILVALYLNLYISNIELERRTQAISYATQILEKVSELYYADVTTENFTTQTLENGKTQIAGIQIPKGYNVTVNIQPYNNNEATDVVKNVEVTVKYNIAKKENILNLSSYKTKEILIIPNAPDLGQNLVAVKVQKNGAQSTYKLTNALDSQWYNYRNKTWALAVEKGKTNETIVTGDLYVWIPRYAYYTDASNKINVEFLYTDKNKTVDDLGNLQALSADYIIDGKFTGDNAKGYWVKLSQMSSDETATRLNNSPYGELIY